jgi:hypothetical protein
MGTQTRQHAEGETRGRCCAAWPLCPRRVTPKIDATAGGSLATGKQTASKTAPSGRIFYVQSIDVVHSVCPLFFLAPSCCAAIGVKRRWCRVSKQAAAAAAAGQGRAGHEGRTGVGRGPSRVTQKRGGGASEHATSAEGAGKRRGHRLAHEGSGWAAGTALDAAHAATRGHPGEGGTRKREGTGNRKERASVFPTCWHCPLVAPARIQAVALAPVPHAALFTRPLVGRIHRVHSVGSEQLRSCAVSKLMLT